MVDTRDLKSLGIIFRAGSSPAPGTNSNFNPQLRLRDSLSLLRHGLVPVTRSHDFSNPFLYLLLNNALDPFDRCLLSTLFEPTHFLKDKKIR